MALFSSSLAQAATNLDLRSHSWFTGCDSIRDIHFEGVCSSSYAITVASVASDTMCGVNKTLANVRISYQNIMECCSECFRGYENGCFGGNYVEALTYLQSTGVVTGSKKATPNTCKNYRLAECYHNPEFVDATTKACGTDPMDFDQYSAVGKCDKTCENAQSKVYDTDLRKGFKVEQVKAQGTDYFNAIKNTLQKSPPAIVITEMAIFEDIYSQKKDEVYIHLYGKFIGTTTVAIFGFGVDPNTQQGYWIVRFPWGSKFGNGGFLMVQSGTNNCGIEMNNRAYYLTYTNPT